MFLFCFTGFAFVTVLVMGYRFDFGFLQIKLYFSDKY